MSKLVFRNRYLAGTPHGASSPAKFAVPGLIFVSLPVILGSSAFATCPSGKEEVVVNYLTDATPVNAIDVMDLSLNTLGSKQSPTANSSSSFNICVNDLTDNLLVIYAGTSTVIVPRSIKNKQIEVSPLTSTSVRALSTYVDIASLSADPFKNLAAMKTSLEEMTTDAPILTSSSANLIPGVGLVILGDSSSSFKVPDGVDVYNGATLAVKDSLGNVAISGGEVFQFEDNRYKSLPVFKASAALEVNPTNAECTEGSAISYSALDKSTLKGVSLSSTITPATCQSGTNSYNLTTILSFADKAIATSQVIKSIKGNAPTCTVSTKPADKYVSNVCTGTQSGRSSTTPYTCSGTTWVLGTPVYTGTCVSPNTAPVISGVSALELIIGQSSSLGGSCTDAESGTLSLTPTSYTPTNTTATTVVRSCTDGTSTVQYNQTVTGKCASGKTWNGTACAIPVNNAPVISGVSSLELVIGQSSSLGGSCSDTESGTLSLTPLTYTMTSPTAVSVTRSCTDGTNAVTASQSLTGKCSTGTGWYDSACRAPVACVGSWANTSTCSNSSGQGYLLQSFSISSAAMYGGSCEASNGATRETTTACDTTPVQSCPSGQHLSGSSCVNDTPTCPSGQTWNGTICDGGF